MHFAICTNTFSNLYRDMGWQWMKSEKSCDSTKIFLNLDRYICQFGQIHLKIWTNTFCSSCRHRLSWCELKELALRERRRGAANKISTVMTLQSC